MEPSAESQALGLVMIAYRHYRAGFLPRSGGYEEQPWFWLACIEEVARSYAAYEAEQHEEMEREREARIAGQGGKKKAQVLGKLRPEDVGPDWKKRLRKVD
jgi:hypothetical protein